MPKHHGYRPAGKRVPEYTSWCNMIQRCTNKGHGSYHNYGGRGIKVCDRWLDFRVFIEDLGPMPVGCAVDRIDPNGNYEPGNVRWYPRGRGKKRTDKLSELDVKLIKYWLVKGYKQADIAKSFGVANNSISNIKTGKMWNYVNI